MSANKQMFASQMFSLHSANVSNSRISRRRVSDRFTHLTRLSDRLSGR